VHGAPGKIAMFGYEPLEMDFGMDSTMDMIQSDLQNFEGTLMDLDIPDFNFYPDEEYY
jgi:hypothetical protein